MKKQIFILTMMMLAFLFAGVKSYGQPTYPLVYQTVPNNIPTCIDPTPLDEDNCTIGDPLHPFVGVPYKYTVKTTDFDDKVRFFVVNNADVKTATAKLIDDVQGILPANSTLIDVGDGTGTYISSITTPGTYNTLDAHRTIEITWKYFDGALPNEILVVAYVEGADGCTNNLIVWRILPNFNFTLDIAALDEEGDVLVTAGNKEDGPCASPIESATYAAVNNGPTLPTGELTVDYGENWLFFIVNAANFNDSWMPEFKITAVGGEGGTATLEASWTYLQAATNTAATAWNSLTDNSGTWTSAVPVYVGGSDANGDAVNDPDNGKAVGPSGECIVVRVRVDHGTTNENTTETDVTLAVNGTMYDKTNYTNSAYEDIHHGDCTTDGFTNDWVTITITPRPEIIADSPTPSETKTGDEPGTVNP